MHQPPSVILSTNNITKSVQSSSPITLFEDISLTLHQGESLAIQGSSGAGKSTLLACLAGITGIDTGSINLLGHALEILSPDQRAEIRREHIGFIFQNFQLLPHLSALENVSLGMEIAGHTVTNALSVAQKTLEQVGLSDQMHHRPHQLSGGEQQRVAIARAVCRQPAIIFADEPTGNLDPQTSQQIMKLLIESKENHHSAIIMVTHDAEVASMMDRQLLLSEKTLATAPKTLEAS